MTDDALEDLVRSRLRAAAPRDVPEQLVLRAAAIPIADRRRRRWPWSAAAHPVGRRARLAFAVLLVGVLAASALLVPRLGDLGGVASPAIPTLLPVSQPSLPPGAVDPTAIQAGAWVSDTVAWLVDGQSRMRMTTDGGQTWSEPRPLPFLQDELRGGPEFIDSSTGYAVWAAQGVTPVEVTVALTHDGGRTWQSTVAGALAGAAGDSNSLTVHFSDPSHGIVLAGDYTARSIPAGHAGAGMQAQGCAGWSTADGGATWAPIPGAPCSDHDFWASPSMGIIMPASDGGPSVSTTLDGGHTWTRGRLPGVGIDDAPFFVVFTLAPDGAPRLAYWVYRRPDPLSTSEPVIVVESYDGGATWQEVYEADVPNAVARETVVALGPDHWLASGVAADGNGTPPVPILETADGGRTWTRVGTLGDINGTSRGWFDRLHGMASGQDNSGCALPSGTPCHVGGFFLTNDGGQTWHGVPF
jgi:photosystem II stability/assembly factor-like uncharacterized protein